MFFELREYHLLPGKRDEWIKIMDERVIPFFASKGKLCFGSFKSLEDPDIYIWIFGRFQSQEEREHWSKEIRAEPYYKSEIEPPAEEMFGVEDPPASDKIVVTRMESTSQSFIR